MIVLYFLLALSIFSAASAFAAGPSRAVVIVIASLIFGGVIFSRVWPKNFEGYLMLLGYGALFIVFSVGAGIASGAMLRARRYWLAVLFFVPMSYFIWNTQSNESEQTKEQMMATEFVTNNNQIAQLAGGPFKVFLSSYSSYNADTKSGHYDFVITGSKKLNVNVAVSRQSQTPTFSISCASDLSSGQREAEENACLQLPVLLSK